MGGQGAANHVSGGWNISSFVSQIHVKIANHTDIVVLYNAQLHWTYTLSQWEWGVNFWMGPWST